MWTEGPIGAGTVVGAVAKLRRRSEELESRGMSGRHGEGSGRRLTECSCASDVNQTSRVV